MIKKFLNGMIKALKDSHEMVSLILGLNCLFAWYLSGDGFILFTGAVLTVVSLVDIIFIEKAGENEV